MFQLVVVSCFFKKTPRVLCNISIVNSVHKGWGCVGAERSAAAQKPCCTPLAPTCSHARPVCSSAASVLHPVLACPFVLHCGSRVYTDEGISQCKVGFCAVHAYLVIVLCWYILSTRQALVSKCTHLLSCTQRARASGHPAMTSTCHT